MEEAEDGFKFYSIDRMAKFDYMEFDNINDAIDKLISKYIVFYDLNVEEIEIMYSIFYETLGLNKEICSTKTKKK